MRWRNMRGIGEREGQKGCAYDRTSLVVVKVDMKVDLKVCLKAK